MRIDNETLTHDQAQSVSTLSRERHSRQIFYGSWLVLASAVGLFWGVPITVYSCSVFFKPLMQEFHASRHCGCMNNKFSQRRRLPWT
jgi:hypothetical protein